VACTRDECVDGTCAYIPDDLLCNTGATDRAHDPDADCHWDVCWPDYPYSDSNGCLPQGGWEVPGSPCDDAYSCTLDDHCELVPDGYGSITIECRGTPYNVLCNTAPRDNDPDADCSWNVCWAQYHPHLNTNGCEPRDNEGVGSPCDDGIGCTINDQCGFGYGGAFQCVGTSACDDADPSTYDYCDLNTRVCVHQR
jgi:hypothetical protein